LARYFEGNRFLQGTERIDIFDFDLIIQTIVSKRFYSPVAIFEAPVLLQADVGFAAHFAFFHISPGNVEIAQDLLVCLAEFFSCRRIFDYRLGHQFDERGAGAIEVDEGVVGALRMG